MSTPDATDVAGARAWRRDVSAAAKKRNIHVVGPGAFGIIRADIGLNATFGTTPTLAGRLALVSQSGAVCTAMLDFAAPMHIGFSSVLSLGGAVDVSFGELLDALVQDAATDGILLYVESVGDARAFLSALRAAARIKPVVVLKAGRSLEPARGPENDDDIAALPDTVFNAALQRAGTVRVRTYTQLFAAARILAMGKIPGGNRLAIVSNGRGPGLLAADSALASGVTLASLDPETVQALDALLPKEIVRTNPVDVRADAPPARLAAAVAATLSDPQVDAVLALHVTRPITPAARCRARRRGGSPRILRSPCWRPGWARSTGSMSTTRWRPAASPTSTRRRTRSRRFRFSPPIAATRNGCSRCRRRRPIRSPPTLRRRSASSRRSRRTAAGRCR